MNEIEAFTKKLELISSILKKRFNNLSVEETIGIAGNILAEIHKFDLGEDLKTIAQLDHHRK